MLASVPLQPLHLDVHEEVGGRTVRRRTAVLRDDERTVAQAHALYVSGPPVDVPPVGDEVVDPPGELAPLPEDRAGWPGFENRAMALHTRRAADSVQGWFRLLVPAVAGRPRTGLQNALAAADYTATGTAMVLSLRRFTFMSVDLTVNLVRQPVGDWVGLEAGRPCSVMRASASPLRHCTMPRGGFGRCTETQVVRSVSPAP